MREAQPEDPDTFPGIEIHSLVPATERISILKVDIEGAEAVVSSRGSLDWLARVDNIAIELHDDTHFGGATEAFLGAIRGQDFRIETAGELVVCRRPGSGSA